MSNTFQAILDSQDAPNHILYSLLYFIHNKRPDFEIDINAPISQIEDCFLVLAVGFLELHHGIEICDAMVEDKSQTFVQLADAIITLSKLSDELFQWQLLRMKAALKAEVDRN